MEMKKTRGKAKKYQSIKISMENYRRMIKIMSRMMDEEGRKISMDEIMEYLFEKAGEKDVEEG